MCVLSIVISFHDHVLCVGDPKSGDVVYIKCIPTVAAVAATPLTYPSSGCPTVPGVPAVPRVVESNRHTLSGTLSCAVGFNVWAFAAASAANKGF